MLLLRKTILIRMQPNVAVKHHLKPHNRTMIVMYLCSFNHPAWFALPVPHCEPLLHLHAQQILRVRSVLHIARTPEDKNINIYKRTGAG